MPDSASKPDASASTDASPKDGATEDGATRPAPAPSPSTPAASDDADPSADPSEAPLVVADSDAEASGQLSTRITESTNLLPIYLQRYDRERTRRSYRTDLVEFFGTDVIDLELARRATFMHVNRHLEDMEARDLKPSTMQRRVAAIRGFFDWLLALDAVDRNPADKSLIRRVRQAHRSDHSITFLTKDQASQLIRATQWVWRKRDGEQVKRENPAHLRDRALILTLIHCVLRRSEAAAMDVDHVRPLGHYWVLDLPEAKGGSDQYVKIPAHVVEAIDEMRSHYEIESGPLWRSLSNRNRGARITPDAIYKMVKRTAQRAELPDIGAHALRHTGCTLAIDAGASIQQVKTHARHKDIDTTMSYIHQREKLRDSAADHIHLDD
jgi:site-specific recombinase XerD